MPNADRIILLENWTTSDILGADQIALDVHHIRNGHVCGDPDHPQVMAQRRGVVRITIIIHHGGIRE